MRLSALHTNLNINGNKRTLGTKLGTKLRSASQRASAYRNCIYAVDSRITFSAGDALHRSSARVLKVRSFIRWLNWPCRNPQDRLCRRGKQKRNHGRLSPVVKCEGCWLLSDCSRESYRIVRGPSQRVHHFP